MTAPRIAPVPAEPADPQLREELMRWMPPGAGVAPLVLFRTLATHPALMQAMRPLGAFILGRKSGLSLRQRELLIDRVCARYACEYEWGVHVAFFAARVGLGAAELAATVHGGADDPVWSDAERTLIRLCDELHDTSRVSGALWKDLRRSFRDEQLVELVVLAGFYHTISFAVNALGVEHEADAPRFPGA